MKSREDFTRSEVQNTGEGGRHENDDRAEQTVQDVTGRRKEVRTLHRAEKEKNGRNDDSTDCDVADIRKRKADAEEHANQTNVKLRTQLTRNAFAE